MENKMFRLAMTIYFNIFLLLFFSCFLYSQETYKLSNEILIYVQPSYLMFPSGECTALPISKIKIFSKELTKAFEKGKVNTIAKAFPDFQEFDSIQINEKGRRVRVPRLSNIFRLKIANMEYVDSSISILSKVPGILYAEKNMNAKLFSDPEYSKQWYLNNTGQSGGTFGADIKAEQAWSIFTGSSSIKIGIIDAGVDINHEDLSGKATGDIPDGDYHGTHVAGIAAAKANNDKGIRGVDWNAQIISKRIFDGGDYIGDIDVANKIIGAVNEGAHILNHSWGGPPSGNSATVHMAFAYAYMMNRVSVAAMGNNNGDQIQYPAGFGQGVIAVGATQDNDDWSPWSNIGNHIDVTAPGGINTEDSTDEHDLYSTWENNTYRFLAGTSMATPVVSGIASLMKGYNTNLYNDDIEHIIQLSADDFGSEGWDQYYGYGRVNAKKALDMLRPSYFVNHFNAYGGNTVGNTGYYTMSIFSAEDLADGTYIVKRYEVQKNVNYSSRIDVNVWGCGAVTVGWSNANPNFSMGWCDVVPGTITSTNATLRTYVYEVRDVLFNFIGYYPTSPASVNFSYSVHGIALPPVVTISGPTNVYCPPRKSMPCCDYTWTANIVNGQGSFSYAWEKNHQVYGAPLLAQIM